MQMFKLKLTLNSLLKLTVGTSTQYSGSVFPQHPFSKISYLNTDWHKNDLVNVGDYCHTGQTFFKAKDF